MPADPHPRVLPHGRRGGQIEDRRCRVTSAVGCCKHIVETRIARLLEQPTFEGECLGEPVPGIRGAGRAFREVRARGADAELGRDLDGRDLVVARQHVGVLGAQLAAPTRPVALDETIEVLPEAARVVLLRGQQQVRQLVQQRRREGRVSTILRCADHDEATHGTRPALRARVAPAPRDGAVTLVRRVVEHAVRELTHPPGRRHHGEEDVGHVRPSLHYARR